MKFTIDLFPSLSKRVQRAAEIRGLDVPTYVQTLLAWHSPAYDNDAAYLREKIRAAFLAADPYDSRIAAEETLSTIEDLIS